MNRLRFARLWHISMSAITSYGRAAVMHIYSYVKTFSLSEAPAGGTNELCGNNIVKTKSVESTNAVDVLLKAKSPLYSPYLMEIVPTRIIEWPTGKNCKMRIWMGRRMKAMTKHWMKQFNQKYLRSASNAGRLAASLSMLLKLINVFCTFPGFRVKYHAITRLFLHTTLMSHSIHWVKTAIFRPKKNAEGLGQF